MRKYGWMLVWMNVSVLWIAAICHAKPPSSIAERVSEYGGKVHPKLKRAFESISLSYPPKEVTLVYVKEQQTLDVYAENTTETLHWITRYPVLAKSGGTGPKLRQGDKQIPEGFYCLESLNPNSLFHLSLRVNYPNSFDKKQARKEGRTQLGGDIMIHGNEVSIGCIAIGDSAIEELFVLAAESSFSSWNVWLSPCSRSTCFDSLTTQPAFMKPVYQQLRERMAQLPKPKLPLK